VTGVTAGFVLICHACDNMLKKSIAAALLVVVMAWAEMALAPMLFMHAGHVHAASEMSESVAGQMAAHHHGMPAGNRHACCPGIGKTENTALLEFAASSQPCQDDHRCCFQQGPQNVPAPVRGGDRLSRDIAPPEIAEFSLAHAESYAFPTTAIALGPPPGLLGMVLRV
jgi:hypothetical protein